MRILHAIHDFLPRHQAGSELYALALCRALQARHHVTVLCADFDPARTHGDVTWRVHDDVPIAEIVNNWTVARFEETYRPALVAERMAHVLHAVQPDVVHVHNLLNLSFDLPAMARGRGAAVVATLHDYTLVCPSGGQRVHRADRHVCHDIDPDRCARCFTESAFHDQAAFGRLATIAGSVPMVQRTAAAAARRLPWLAGRAADLARNASVLPVTRQDIVTRLDAARSVFQSIDLFVAPSQSIADEFLRFGVEPSKMHVSDYGFAPMASSAHERSPTASARVVIGFVGTLVWHKGVHVLLEAVRGLPLDAYELRIFGDANMFPAYSAELRTLAEGRPVRFMGAFNRNDAAGVYGALDVLVVPSLWLENSPLVIHEAFMAGVPVVGARIGGIASLVEEGNTGWLYEPESVDALAARLRQLVENPASLHTLKRTGFPRVKSIDENAKEWEGLYEKVVGPRSVGHVA